MRRRRDQSPSAGILQSEQPIDTADQELLVRRLEFKQVKILEITLWRILCLSESFYLLMHILQC